MRDVAHGSSLKEGGSWRSRQELIVAPAVHRRTCFREQHRRRDGVAADNLYLAGNRSDLDRALLGENGIFPRAQSANRFCRPHRLQLSMFWAPATESACSCGLVNGACRRFAERRQFVEAVKHTDPYPVRRVFAGEFGERAAERALAASDNYQHINAQHYYDPSPLCARGFRWRSF